ncbi:MAG: nickel pincer cofactor biosynthesis protein LarB, partial [Calditrichaeota bacterium]|nr:nickel pincer cofactor biosynthesis protein LarB [Calditrichota bacterium]
YDSLSRTAFYGAPEKLSEKEQIAVITAGSSDLPVSREAIRTLAFNGFPVREINDVGVAGIWRLMERVDEFRDLPIKIVVAGMDAALVSVIGGLVPGIVIGVPTAVGYGVADRGKTALHAMLTSCAPGIVTVNIDNGYGAAIAAIRFLRELNK